MINWFAEANFTCTKFILHTLRILHHVSAHHTCHHQGVFVAIISIDSEVKTSKPTALWQYQLSKPTALWQYQLSKPTALWQYQLSNLCSIRGSHKDIAEESNCFCVLQESRQAISPTDVPADWEMAVFLPLAKQLRPSADHTHTSSSSLVFSPKAGYGRNQSPVRRPVWLWHTAF